MKQTQLRNKYNGLKDGYNTERKNMEIKLKAQNKLNAKHFNESMKNLEAQFKETERQRKVQQNLLKKHYEHQKYLMKKRHLELLKIKEKLQNCNDDELTQMNKEKELNERHQKLMDIQRDYEIRNDKTQSNRKLLEQKKQLILNEMAEFDKITGTMSHLNLNTELTEKQMKEIEEFMKHNPEMNKNIEYDDNYDELIGSDDGQSSDEEETESDEDEYSQKYRRRQSKRERKRILSRKKSRGRQQRRRKNSGYVGKNQKSNDRDLTRSQSPQVRRYSNRKKNVSIQVRKSNKAKNNKKIPRRSRSIGRSIFGFGKKKNNKNIVKKKQEREEREEEREEEEEIEYESEKEVKTKKKSKQKKKNRGLLKSGTLYVRLVQARGIFGKKGQKPNSYVELECCDEIYHSSVIKKNSNPEWNEFFKFYVNNYEEDMLILRLIDAKNDHSLAKIKLPVYEFVQEVKDNENYKLNQNVDLNLDVMYEAEYDNDAKNRNGKKPSKKRRKSFSQKVGTLFKKAMFRKTNKKNKKKKGKN